MSSWLPFCEAINLYVEGRIPKEDADRQALTARAILERLIQQPGVILADEVGMGKTFVALAVAVSVALATRPRRPVVIMVPPSLREKWPSDFQLFREKCLPRRLAGKINSGTAESATAFLKLLDDPPNRRKAIVFVTHGAMSRGLRDKWVKLALIYQALRHRPGADQYRKVIGRALSDLLLVKWAEKKGKGVWEELLTTPPAGWLEVFRKWGIDPEDGDDPVPEAVRRILPKLNTESLFQSLNEIPWRHSKHYDHHIKKARQHIEYEVRVLWEGCIKSLQLRMPLLILDEAHHLKNPGTRLASLFQISEAREDAEELKKGALHGTFERMLFLTATPFQLGHHELCSVLDRFEGITWISKTAPSCGSENFQDKLGRLKTSLDEAQEAALALDNAWGCLKPDDLTINGQPFLEVEAWWPAVQTADKLPPTTKRVIYCYRRAQELMRTAEVLLQPWVIRHLRPRHLPYPYESVVRRRQFSGAAILTGISNNTEGIIVAGDALLPFLLAARASYYDPESRPLFAEGLASSYEAFMYTRMRGKDSAEGSSEALIEDDDDPNSLVKNKNAEWYLEQLEAFLPLGDGRISAAHPKVAATVQRALNIWEAREKVLVFCHYVATGKVLRQRIADAISQKIALLGAEKLRCDPQEVPMELERLGKRFFDQDSPIRRACDAEVSKILKTFLSLRTHREQLMEGVRRYVRTPSFLVRYFPLEKGRLAGEDMASALNQPDQSGFTLGDLLRSFFVFLVERCGEQERQRYIEAVSSIQTGTHVGKDVSATYLEDELQGEPPEQLIPNVRLVNGRTGAVTRQRLMLTFNTPFYPEVLIASSVMAEGVDLHLNCRHVIHHDLCWNPSNLEQRTGRVDRIGAKVEQCHQPIFIYLPYVAETQDEKMYRVVMDRERWFSVVMGEKYQIDLRNTEKLANRIQFPESAARNLAFRLEADHHRTVGSNSGDKR